MCSINSNLKLLYTLFELISPFPPYPKHLIALPFSRPPQNQIPKRHSSPKCACGKVAERDFLLPSGSRARKKDSFLFTLVKSIIACLGCKREPKEATSPLAQVKYTQVEMGETLQLLSTNPLNSCLNHVLRIGGLTHHVS